MATRPAHGLPFRTTAKLRTPLGTRPGRSSVALPSSTMGRWRSFIELDGYGAEADCRSPGHNSRAGQEKAGVELAPPATGRNATENVAGASRRPTSPRWPEG